MRALLGFGVVMATAATARADYWTSNPDSGGHSHGSGSGAPWKLDWAGLSMDFGGAAHIYDGRTSLGTLGRLAVDLPVGLYALFAVENGRLTADAPKRDDRTFDQLSALNVGLGLHHTLGWLTVGGDVAYGTDRLCADGSCAMAISHRHVEVNAVADVWISQHILVGANLGLGVARTSDEMIGVHVGIGIGGADRKGLLDGLLTRLSVPGQYREPPSKH